MVLHSLHVAAIVSKGVGSHEVINSCPDHSCTRTAVQFSQPVDVTVNDWTLDWKYVCVWTQHCYQCV